MDSSHTDKYEVICNGEVFVVGKNRESLEIIASLNGGIVRPYTGKPVVFPKKTIQKKKPVIY